MRVIVTGVVMSCMTSVFMPGMHAVIHANLVVLATGFATVVTRLSLAMFMVLTITLALVRRAVALPTWVVIAGAHWCLTFVPAVMLRF